MNKLTSTLIGCLIAIFAFAGINYLAGDNVDALNPAARDCESNSIIYCGATTPSELKTKYNENKTGDLPAIFSHYGVSAAMVNGMTQKQGHITRSGDVVYNGKVVATGAISVGRNSGVGTPVKINGKTYYQHGAGQNWAAGVDAIAAHIWFDADGKFIGAVYYSCGNPVVAKPIPVPPKPVYACNALTASATKITAGQNVTFTTKASAANGAVVKAYTYDFGDGAKATAAASTSHVYAKPGTYTAKVTVTVTVNGKDVVAPGTCAVQITVAPQPCEVPGKEQYPKDSPECFTDKPAISITKTVNSVEHVKVAVNEAFKYTIVVKNTGNVALKNAVVTDKAPAQVVLVSSDAGKITDNTWTYTIAELKVGESKTFTISAKYAKYATGTHKNTVCVDTPSIKGNPDGCDDATTETFENIVVCDLKDNTVKTIDRSQYDESHMTTDREKCGNMHVCVIEEKVEKDIAKKDFDEKTMTTDMSKCVETPVPPAPTPEPESTPEPTPVVELPHTGLTEGVTTVIGAGSLVGVGLAYAVSRRNLR